MSYNINMCFYSFVELNDRFIGLINWISLKTQIIIKCQIGSQVFLKLNKDLSAIQI